MIKLPVKRSDLVKELGLQSVAGKTITIEGQRGSVSSYHEFWKLPDGSEVEATDFESGPAEMAERKFAPADINALLSSGQLKNHAPRTGTDFIEPFWNTPPTRRKSYRKIVVYSSQGRILYDSNEQDMTCVAIPK